MNNTRDGIILVGSNNNTIYNNTAVQNKQNGIVLEFGSNGNNVTENNVTFNNRNGIFLNGSFIQCCGRQQRELQSV